ncbi:AI-2E family transporter [Arthrobacter sp. MI7-26]|uniref:AI-2E family transporter n=1 Tax=Arthrobacter sp. MI7-26 TaxID=2993653 RepID=UPI0022492D40|nr:AI-2E family transporter [Arthrobacter sp. MI7-26]MCX2747879.1 AI-2E family transporter [Arthrobacter sp. MI7-26]
MNPTAVAPLSEKANNPGGRMKRVMRVPGSRGPAVRFGSSRSLRVGAPRNVDGVPVGVQVAGEWSWRLLAIAAVVGVLLYLVVTLHVIAVPFFVAIVLSAMLVPFKDMLVRHRWPKWLAVTTTEGGMLAVIAGLLLLVISQVASSLSGLGLQSTKFLGDLREELLASPFGASSTDLDRFLGDALQSVQANEQDIASGLASLGSGVGEIAAGTALALFATLFILIDGVGIWTWFTRLVPRRARERFDHAGKAGWATLRSFAKVQIFVALINGVGIGIGTALLGVPLAIPIAVLVFLGSFIPVVGAIATGAVAVFIALVYNGWIVAVAMLAVVLLVHQIESHVLHPVIMGNAVKVHPLAVMFAVAGGSVLAGIPGAFFAVPVAAVLNTMVTALAGQAGRGEDE